MVVWTGRTTNVPNSTWVAGVEGIFYDIGYNIGYNFHENMPKISVILSKWSILEVTPKND